MRPAARLLAALAAVSGLVLTGPPVRAQQVLVDFGSAVTYLANNADPGLAMTWTAETFDDSAWASGTYGVGYETGTGAQALIQTSVPTDTVSVYTRARFDVADPATIRGLALGMDYDDAVVAWINGVEVWRAPEMPAGTPAWNASPTLHESSNAATPQFSPYQDITAAALPVLHAGTNVLALGLWNAALPSSDLVVVPQLLANPPPDLSRGPYLQMGTPDAVTVRWRTMSPADSEVRWGDAPGNLVNVLSSAIQTTEHELRITGLQPATRYYYSIGMTGATLAGNDVQHAFTTPPRPGTRSRVHAWIVGDSGTASADARRVRDAWRTRDAGAAPDLWLMLGDNAYLTGTDAEYQRAVFETYQAELRRSVLWPTFGNHDALSASATTESGVYFSIFTLPRAADAGGVPSGTEAYYSFDWANVHFVCLDSQESDRSPTGAMADWLQRDLASTSQEWVVAFFHHPPYTKGSHDSDTETRHIQIRQNILPILEDFGVDLILSGHSHAYERSLLVDGHYGDSTTLVPANILDAGDGRETGDGAYTKAQPGLAGHSGEVCVVAGSSGQTSGGPLNHPAMYVSLNVLGSFVLDVQGERLDGTFVDDAGAVRDTFTILKQRPVLTEDCGNGTDDDADGLADCADPDCRALDGDSDTVPDCADCAPADGGSFSVPPEVPLLRLAKIAAGLAEATLTWDDVSAACGTGVVGDVATGVVRELWGDRGFARATCLVRDVVGGITTDPRPAPQPSDGFWYLSRGRNACGAGDWGGARVVPGCP